MSYELKEFQYIQKFEVKVVCLFGFGLSKSKLKVKLLDTSIQSCVKEKCKKSLISILKQKVKKKIDSQDVKKTKVYSLFEDQSTNCKFSSIFINFYQFCQPF